MDFKNEINEDENLYYSSLLKNKEKEEYQTKQLYLFLLDQSYSMT